MKTTFTRILLGLNLMLLVSLDLRSQIITRTYESQIGAAFPKIYTINVDLDGIDDYSFVHHSGLVSGDWSCNKAYVRPLHNNALIGSFNNTSTVAKVFDNGALIDDLAATYRYDSDTNAFMFRHQYLFSPGPQIYSHYGYIPFKLNGRFGYFYVGFRNSSISSCNNSAVDNHLGIELYYSRYEQTQETPLKIINKTDFNTDLIKIDLSYLESGVYIPQLTNNGTNSNFKIIKK